MKKVIFVLAGILAVSIAVAEVAHAQRIPGIRPPPQAEAAPSSGGTPIVIPEVTEEDFLVNEENTIVIAEQYSRAVVFITSFSDDPALFPISSFRIAVGSGFFIDDQGHILTNAHVVIDAAMNDNPFEFIRVRLKNGREVNGVVIGYDPDNDIAVLSLEEGISRDEYAIAPLGDSDTLRVGQKVIAIGHQFGSLFPFSVSDGIVSGIGRLALRANAIGNIIQTDAAVNPGNSGGPLFNSRGEVVGINAAIIDPGATRDTQGRRIAAFAGVSLAIPINTARRVLPDLLEFGRFRRPQVGVSFVPLLRESFGDELWSLLNLPVRQGVLVQDVFALTAAAEAGLREGPDEVEAPGMVRPIIGLGGDIITAIDGEPIIDADDFISMISMHHVDDTIVLSVLRRGEDNRYSIALEILLTLREAVRSPDIP